LKGGKNFGKWGLGGFVHIYMTRLVWGRAGARETPFVGVALLGCLREHMKPRTARAALSKGFVEVNTASVERVGTLSMWRSTAGIDKKRSGGAGRRPRLEALQDGRS